MERRTGRRITARATPVRPSTHAPSPQPVAPSVWMLPDATTADDDGVVGVGADLAPGTLVDAYRRGIFPWPHPGLPLPWFSPHPRGVIEPDRIAVSRSLRRTLRHSGWHVSIDRAFGEVVAGCAVERGDDGTWITPSMSRAYRRLHELGWAHSVEVWDGATLVGGLYGVQVGGVFTGESMFHRASDASKVALLALGVRLHAAGGTLIDVQLTTPHLCTLGAVDLDRARFLDVLHQVRDDDVRLLIADEPVTGLLMQRTPPPPTTHAR